MRVEEAYKNLTKEAKRQAIKDLVALARERNERSGELYIKQVLQGIRPHRCSPQLARLISGYFRGQIGIDVAPEEVVGRSDLPVIMNGTPNETIEPARADA